MQKRQLLAQIHKEFPKLEWKNAVHNVEGWDHYVIVLVPVHNLLTPL